MTIYDSITLQKNLDYKILSLFEIIRKKIFFKPISLPNNENL